VFHFDNNGNETGYNLIKSQAGDYYYDTATQTTTYYMVESITNDARFASRITKSVDGINWTDISSTFTEKLEPGKKRNFWFIGVAGNQVIYTTYSGGDWTNQGIVRTTDGGNSWNILMQAGSPTGNNVTNEGPADYFGGFLGWTGIGQGLGASKTNPDVAIMTNMADAYMTKDGGVTWEALSSTNTGGENGDERFITRGIEPAGIYDFEADPHDNQHLMMGYADIGLFYSYDGGESWEGTKTWKNRTNGITRSNEFSQSPYGISFDPDIKDYVIVTWSGIHGADGAGKGYASVKAGNNYTGGITRSTDGGKTWISSMPVYADGYPTLESDPERNSGLPTKAITTDVWIDPNSGDGVNWQTRHVYVTCVWFGVYRSTNGGQTFAKYSAGMEQEAEFSGWKFAASQDGEKLYVIFNPEGATKNEYAGAMFMLDVKSGNGIWRKINMPTECDTFRDISIDGNGAIYTTGYYKYKNEKELRNSGAFVSTDNGTTWKVIYPQEIISRAIHVDSRNPDIIYLGNEKGELLLSRKGVNTTVDDWEFVTEKFPHPKLSGIYEDPTDSEWIYVGTVCGGTWHVKVENPDDSGTVNPTIDNKRLKEGEKVEVYNLNGSLVRIYKASQGDILENALENSALPTGIYIVKAGNKSAKVVKK
jgi:hypothetical protein